jgi:hypothetical protein
VALGLTAFGATLTGIMHLRVSDRRRGKSAPQALSGWRPPKDSDQRPAI